MEFQKHLKAYFGKYNRLEIALKTASILLGMGYVFYVYTFGDGLGTMVPRYAGY